MGGGRGRRRGGGGLGLTPAQAPPRHSPAGKTVSIKGGAGDGDDGAAALHVDGGAVDSVVSCRVRRGGRGDGTSAVPSSSTMRKHIVVVAAQNLVRRKLAIQD